MLSDGPFFAGAYLTGPLLAACALLMLAGVQKLIDPLPLVRATGSAGVRLPRGAVRAGAAGELLVGAWAAGTGSRTAAALVGLSYTAFTGFVLLALRRGGVLASCGCFGRADLPPTRAHAAVTAGFALAAFLVAAGPGAAGPGAAGPGAALLAGDPAVVPLVLAAAALSGTAYAVLAVLPLIPARPAR